MAKKRATLVVRRDGDTATIVEYEAGYRSPLRSYSFSADAALIIGGELVRIGTEIARQEKRP